MPQPYDLIIIGGGIIGSMTARYLSRYQLSILLIDRETDICMGTTSGNSAFVHAGYDPVPGSLKADHERGGQRALRAALRGTGLRF